MGLVFVRLIELVLWLGLGLEVRGEVKSAWVLILVSGPVLL